MERPLISVIVPIYNAEKYLDRCVQSILRQTYKNLEIILIDDGSTDQSSQIMRRYESQDHRVVVYSKKNGGVSSARNAGLKMMRGHYCTFVDPDDYVQETYVEQLYQAIIDSNVQISICDRLMPSEEEVRQYVSDPNAIFETNGYVMKTIEVLPVEKYAYFGKYCHLSVYCTLFDTNILKDLFFYETVHISEDALFFIQAYLRCRKMACISSKLYCYIQYKNSAVHGVYTYKHWTSIQAWQNICQLCDKESKLLSNSARAWYVMLCAGQVMEICNSSFTCKENKKTNYLIREIRKYRKAIKYIPKEKRALRIRTYATALFPRITAFLLWHYYQWKKS